MAEPAASICPGCGLSMPASPTAVYDGYYHTSPECWGLYTEVLGTEFSHPYLFGKVHQLTVDTYAVQHAGGPHPDKSIGVHLAGLCLVLEQGLPPTQVPPLLKRLADTIDTWPHLPPPDPERSLTVCEVALAGTPDEHVTTVRAWAEAVWQAWAAHHGEVRKLAGRF